MKHRTAVALLRRHGFTVSSLPGNWHQASLRERDGSVSWFRLRDDAKILAVVCDIPNVPGVTTVPRFIEVVKRHRWALGDDVLEVGPDATAPGCRWSVRVYRSTYLVLGRFCGTAIMGEALRVVRGELPPGVFLDWLKEKGHLPC